MKFFLRLFSASFLFYGHTVYAQLYKTPLLESLPSSPYVIFLDFDGQKVKSQYWNSGLLVDAAPSNSTENDIRMTWTVVSEDYSPFNINVTTDSTVFHRAEKGKRVRCIFSPTSAWANIFSTTGVAILSSFTIASEDVPCWAFNAIGRTGGEVASHEIGHTLGLSHDGRQRPGLPFEEYFPGQNKWGSIMSGSFSSSMITQWSKGEYNYATNTEDDIAIIARPFNGFGYRPDDAGNTIATAKDLAYNTNGTFDRLNDGIITDRDDVDVYKFTTTGGQLIINADVPPIVIVGANDSARTGNLDIAMTLMDENGGTVASYNGIGKMSAYVNINIAAGTYYISIDGVGKLDPAVDGYSDYGSIGQYFLRGSIPVGTNQAPIVKIEFPPDHTSVLGTMSSMYANAFDLDGTISRVDFYNYDTLFVANPPYNNMEWPSGQKAGTYKITARAYDNQGAYSDSPPFYAEYVLPEVKLITPLALTSYADGAMISLTATAQVQSRFQISSVDFYDGNTLIYSDNSAPYSYDWAAPTGDHTIYAKANTVYQNGYSWTPGVAVTVVPNPPASFTTSDATPCEGSVDIEYTFANVAFGYTYEWEYSGTGFSITSGDGTNSILAAFAPGATSGTLSVKSVRNGVQSTALTKAITISLLPAIPSAIAGNSTPEAGGINAYSVTAVNDVTYQWSYSRSDAALTPAGPDVTLDFSEDALPGTLSVVAKNRCGNSTASTLPLAVTPPPPPAPIAPMAPTAFVTSTDSVCSGLSNVEYSVAPVADVTFTWSYSGTGFTITSGNGTNAITSNFGSDATPGVLSVTANRNGLSSTPLTMDIDIRYLPADPEPITGNAEPEAGTANEYMTTVVGNATLTWLYNRTDATLAADGAAATLSFSETAQDGILSVAAENSCGSSEPANLLIHVRQTVTTGLETSEPAISIYPNPSTGKFTLHLPSTLSGRSFQVVDPIGKTVYQSTALIGENSIDLSHTAKGIYLLYINSESQSRVIKMVLE